VGAGEAVLLAATEASCRIVRRSVAHRTGTPLFPLEGQNLCRFRIRGTQVSPGDAVTSETVSHPPPLSGQGIQRTGAMAAPFPLEARAETLRGRELYPIPAE